MSTSTASPVDGAPDPPAQIDQRPFLVDGPLPAGTTVLEASAGTGKTYAIEALAVRYVAEGVAPLERLLLITFGRNATAELRDRVRRRFLSVTRALDPALADVAPTAPPDPLVAFLRSGPVEVVAARRRRLQAALVGFDSSTIETTHGFCNQMLAVLGLAGDSDPTPALVEDSDEVVTEVVTDLYVDRFGRPDSPPPELDHARAVALARAAVADPDAIIEPADAVGPAGERVSLTTAARIEVAARKKRRGLRDYDDMLLSLRDALRGPGVTDIAARRLRARYQIVLVDEFQDTDPVQWDILAAAFHEHATLILVGDPKQAIYAFRGADVLTYQKAIAVADDRWTLPVNHRSDAGLVAAVLDLTGGVSLGEGITVPAVTAAHAEARLSGTDLAALRIRVVDRSQVQLTRAGLTSTPATRQFVAADVARDVVARLAAGPSATRFDDGGGPRPLTAGDIAVLVRTNEQGVRVRDALTAAGVPVTLSGAASVFRSAAAADWLTVLAALEQPHRAGLVGRAALSVFVGWTAARLGTAEPSQLDALTATLRGWGRVLDQRGVPALTEVMSAAFELPRRVLSTVGGERVLTDARHVSQALHVAVGEGHRGVSALTSWLRQQIRHAASDPSEERSQRLDSDSQAVQVLTIHRSKGLQYPIVYAPFLWDRYSGRVPDPLLFHRPDGRRVLDVGGPDGPRPPHWSRLADAEQYGEDLRLLYVAFTRAVSQVVTWWAPSSTTPGSPLHRMLFGRDVDGVLPHEVVVPADAEARRELAALVARAAGTIAVESAATGTVAPLASPGAGGQPISVRTFQRRIDDGWQRTSYSRVTSGLHEHAGGVGSEPDGSYRDDEPLRDGAPVDGATLIGAAPDIDPLRTWRDTPSPMGDFPAGAAFGTFVHSVLEGTDMTTPDLLAELTGRAIEVGGHLPATVTPQELAAALVTVIETPLGPLAGGRRLRDIPSRDRLDELSFELPLAGGDRAARSGARRGGDSEGGAGGGGTGDGDDGAAVADVAALLRLRLPPADVLAGYAARLDQPGVAGRRMLGYLTGSIDAVLRVRAPDGTPRYLVVDYKTNRLGESRTLPLTAWHYRPEALAAEMSHAHYPLQAMLYSVALHRFLRHRQPGYAPERHLGGVLYLFVRGMSGAATPAVDGVPAGVFSWRPPVQLVEDLSALLDTGVLATGPGGTPDAPDDRAGVSW